MQHAPEFAAALDELLAGPSLSVVFQPIVDLRRAEPYGYEVLGRCRLVDGPLAEAARSPASLLALAAGHGRLLRLDRRWRELALEIIAAEADDTGYFFLNVDPRVLEDPEYTPGYTLGLTERHGLPAARFVLELTEIASRDPAAIERLLAQYARQGFRVALDDLGAGQQSLVTLLRVAPAIVKLDRDLVRAVDTDPTRMHLLRALVGFADRTGVLLIAEGIETAGELRAVIDAGVPLGQGFLLGRPAPRPGPLAGEVRSMLKQQRASVLAHDGPRRIAEPGNVLLELVESLRTAKERAMDHLLACASALLDAERISVHLVPEAPAPAPGAEATPEAAWIARVAEFGAPLRFDRLAGTRGAFLGVPLLDESGPVGVLAVSSAAVPAFSVAEERRLQLVAGIAAPYIRAARDSWHRARQVPSASR